MFPILSNLDIDRHFAERLVADQNAQYMGCMDKRKFSKKIRELARKDNINKFAVINLDPDGGGTHWVAIWKSDPKLMYYFDPFGVIPDATIYQTLKKSCRPLSEGKVLYNTKQIQDVESIMCGYYCIYFLEYLLNKSNSDGGNDYLDFVMLWDDDTKKNEQKIKGIFEG